MNIIDENTYTLSLQELGKILPRPAAVMVVSAHWQTRGTYVTSAATPPTIYDFYGFPPALYRVKYETPGSAAIAERVRTVSGNLVSLDADGESTMRPGRCSSICTRRQIFRSWK